MVLELKSFVCDAKSNILAAKVGLLSTWFHAILQGIRRVIAVTASEAEEAVSKAEGLTKAMDAAEKLEASQLDAKIAGLRQV